MPKYTIYFTVSDGAETRYLLADGAESVRAELISDTVEAVPTYSPYGNLLARTGSIGTIYGFNDEQCNTATELLYLRARYPTFRLAQPPNLDHKDLLSVDNHILPMLICRYTTY